MMTNGIRSFKDQLKELRSTTGLTYQEIADRMGFTGAYISHIIKRGPTVDQMVKIAEASGVQPEYFDMYHVLSFADKVMTGDPVARTFAKAMSLAGEMGERKRRKYLETILESAS